AGARMRFWRRVREILAVEDDPPAARPSLAHEAIKNCRAAGAVRPNQPDDIALVDCKIGASDGAEFAELFRHIGRVQKFVAVRHGAVSAKPRAAPAPRDSTN